MFAKLLQQSGVEVKHIDNPVVHLQLDEADAFLSKTRNAVKNLKKLNTQDIHLNTRLEATVNRITKLRLTSLVKWILNMREPAILKNLHSSQPRMRLLDYYKLLHYLKA